MLTCEEKMRLGLKTFQDCQDQYLVSGVTFVIGIIVLLIVAFIVTKRP
jgi:hypothetical protein